VILFCTGPTPRCRVLSISWYQASTKVSVQTISAFRYVTCRHNHYHRRVSVVWELNWWATCGCGFSAAPWIRALFIHRLAMFVVDLSDLHMTPSWPRNRPSPYHLSATSPPQTSQHSLDMCRFRYYEYRGNVSDDGIIYRLTYLFSLHCCQIKK